MRNRCSFLVALAFATGAVSPAAAQIPDSIMYAHFIDVGQGSAVLLEFSCGAVMIDAGGQGARDTENLISYLGGFFDRRPDLDSTIATIILTHNHADHTRALLDVVAAFRVHHVVEQGMRGGDNDHGDRPLRLIAEATGEEPGAGVVLIAVDERDVTSGNFGLTTPEIDPVDCAGTDPAIAVLWTMVTENPGWSQSAFGNKNNHGLVVRVDFGAASFLFTGDLEVPAIRSLVAFYEDTPMLRSDVYHVGHHGSHNGTSWLLLEALDRPQIAVISMGACTRLDGIHNAFRYGHPRADIVEMLRAAITRRRTPKRVPIADGIRNFRTINMRQAVFATGWDGTVRVWATAGGRYRVNVERREAPEEC